MTTVVVYVHGLWLPGTESFLLRRRLGRALDAQTRMFTYPSVAGTLTDSAVALGKFLSHIPADALHLVAHSMGGLVVLRLFELGAVVLPPGRIVLTASPVCGSLSAARLARLPLGSRLLGRTAGEVLVARREPRWNGARELGVIAGDRAAGLGRLLGPLEGPNDGTVRVAETELPGATDRLQLSVSHSGMVFAPIVAAQAAMFLRAGRFRR